MLNFMSLITILHILMSHCEQEVRNNFKKAERSNLDKGLRTILLRCSLNLLQVNILIVTSKISK